MIEQFKNERHTNMLLKDPKPKNLKLEPINLSLKANNSNVKTNSSRSKNSKLFIVDYLYRSNITSKGIYTPRQREPRNK